MFAVGDVVRVRADRVKPPWPPGTVCVVRAVDAGGWLTVGRVAGGEMRRVGWSYFRISGRCGMHAAAGWDAPERTRRSSAPRPSQSGWAVCGRCGMPMPEHLSGYHMVQAGARLVPRWWLR